MVCPGLSVVFAHKKTRRIILPVNSKSPASITKKYKVISSGWRVLGRMQRRLTGKGIVGMSENKVLH